jgi:hypothetical protein
MVNTNIDQGDDVDDVMSIIENDSAPDDDDDDDSDDNVDDDDNDADNDNADHALGVAPPPTTTTTMATADDDDDNIVTAANVVATSDAAAAVADDSAAVGVGVGVGDDGGGDVGSGSVDDHTLLLSARRYGLPASVGKRRKCVACPCVVLYVVLDLTITSATSHLSVTHAFIQSTILLYFRVGASN